MAGKAAGEVFRVAIIGGGIAGATASFYLRQLFGSKVSITLFEQSGRIGGRIKCVQFEGSDRETGARFFHSNNHYMLSFTKKFGLETTTDLDSNQRIMFYSGNGHSSFTTLGSSSFMASIRILLRYGMDVVRVIFYTRKLIKDFSRIYSIQDRGHCFTTSARLLKALRPEFVEMTQRTYDEWLTQKLHLGEKIRKELAFTPLSYHYCQNPDAHAFVGFISMAPLVPQVCGIKGGVEQLPQKLVQHVLNGNQQENHSRFIHAKVTSITQATDSERSWKVGFYKNDSTLLDYDTFDYVIIAAPLHQQSEIETDSTIKLPSTVYKEMDRSLFSGALRHSKFGITPGSYTNRQAVFILPNQECYEKDKSFPFRSLYSIPQKNQVAGEPRIWESYSESQITVDPAQSIGLEFIENTNGRTVPTLTVRWLAYPVYKPVKNPEMDLGQFVLAPNLFYANAIELVASCMETSAIGGRNVALLVAADRQKRNSESNQQSQTPLVHVDDTAL